MNKHQKPNPQVYISLLYIKKEIFYKTFSSPLKSLSRNFQNCPYLIAPFNMKNRKSKCSLFKPTIQFGKFREQSLSYLTPIRVG